MGLPTAVGVALIGGTLHTGDVLGVAMALMAALSWAAYIMLSRRMGSAGEGLAGLCLASIVGAVVMVPVGFAVAGHCAAAPWHAVAGAAGRGDVLGHPVQPRPAGPSPAAHAVFGVLVSLNPAVAALAGLIVLGQHLPAPQLVGIAFVIAASGGITAVGA